MPTTHRLILLFDGTWNDPSDHTNVFRLSQNILPIAHADDGTTIPQSLFYDPGVGTTNASRFFGGVFAAGLKRNLCEGYAWLAQHYADGVEIWVFGFSRGAYTARSLVGMIRKCGLLREPTQAGIEKAEQLYRDKSVHPDDPHCVEFRAQNSREVKIRFIGVWDTVGALGIPGTLLSERDYFAWHDTQLSKIVEHAYHALALDEHRAVYDAVLWTSDDGAKKPEHIDVEQRWFIGAHSNVGGGYNDPQDRLPDITLAWMQQKAAAAGLALKPFSAAPDAYACAPADSFREFLGGAYAVYRRVFHAGDGRYVRRFNTDAKGKPAINITVDASVWAREKAFPDYRPATLRNAGINPPEPIKPD